MDDSIIFYIVASLSRLFLDPTNLIIILIGSFIGLLFGALPGITSVAGVAMLLPFSIFMPPNIAINFLLGAYIGAASGGGISAILYRIPGSSEAVATVFDGYEMTKKGRVVEALTIQRFYSLLGCLVAGVLALLITQPLADLAVKFGPAEIFMLAIMAITFLSMFEGGFKALLGVFLGFFLATIGMDPYTGVSRFTFGITEIESGLYLLPIFLGLFAVPEAIRLAINPPPPLTTMTALPRLTTRAGIKLVLRGFMFPERSFFIRTLPLIFLVAIPIGFIIGVLPAIGATTAAIYAYLIAKGISRNPQKYGTGVPEGVAVPESANNAASIGTLVPTLALGIPGGGVTAILLGVLIIHGVRPGPLIFVHNPLIPYSILVGAMVVAVLAWALTPIIIYLFVKILEMFRKNIPILVVFIILISSLSTYIVRNQVIDLWILAIFSVLGFIFERYRYPIAPIAIGFVLGDLFEVPFRRALDISGGDPSIFLRSNISISLLIITVITALIPRLVRIWSRRRGVR
jgi:putative tricarboxylic transport membrane protein